MGMTANRAPRHLIAAVCEGLINGQMTLRSSVIVPNAPQRRDARGWPAVTLAAVIVGPNMAGGVPAVWATSEDGAPVMALDGAAREFSAWPAPGRGHVDTGVDVEGLLAYPEVDRALQIVLLLEERAARVGRTVSGRDQTGDGERPPN